MDDAIVLYAGRFGGPGLPDTTPGATVLRSVERAAGAWVNDPLSFPWELFSTSGPTCPLIIDLSSCSSDDRRALEAVLASLTPSDALLGDRDVVERLCRRLGLENLWHPDDLDAASFASTHSWSKRADMEERAIIERLSHDGELVIVTIDGSRLRSVPSFALLLGDLIASNDCSTIDTIWGIHPYPGRPVDRAVVALRRAAAE